MKARLLIAGVLVVTGGALSHAAAQEARDAKTLYQENCKKCHGVLGTPPKTMKALGAPGVARGAGTACRRSA